MKHSLIKATLCFCMVLSLLINILISGFAQQEVGSNVDVGFEISTDPVAPVDPEDPGTPSGETGTDQPGPLSLDWVPVLNFGNKHIISATVSHFNTRENFPYVQVTDLRGTGSGWKVTAALSKFKQGDDDTLQGAYITFVNGKAASVATDVNPPDPNPAMTLYAGGEADLVANAKKEDLAGRGTWVIRWFPDGGGGNYVTLTVPAARASEGAHRAQITWVLYNSP